MKSINKNYIYRLIVISSIVFCLHACVEDVPITNQTNFLGLVVDGKITTDTTIHTVILKKSNDIENKNPIEFISNAIVTITSGDDVFQLTENPFKKGNYETLPTVYGVPGKEYTLHISNVDVNGDGVMENYSATSLLKKENPIDAISFVTENVSSDFRGVAVNLDEKEIGGGMNFYLTKVYKNGKLLTDSLSEFGHSDNTGFEGKYYSGYTVYFLDYNKPDERISNGDTITLEVDGVSKDYFNFVLGFITESQPKNPIFSGPSSNPHSNIKSSSNAVGFFAAYSIERKSKIYTKDN